MAYLNDSIERSLGFSSFTINDKNLTDILEGGIIRQAPSNNSKLKIYLEDVNSLSLIFALGGVMGKLGLISSENLPGSDTPVWSMYIPQKAPNKGYSIKDSYTQSIIQQIKSKKVLEILTSVIESSE